MRQAAAVPPPPRPKGKGPIKRTPTGAFDPAAKDDDIYQCEKIVAQRLAKGGVSLTLTGLLIGVRVSGVTR